MKSIQRLAFYIGCIIFLYLLFTNPSRFKDESFKSEFSKLQSDCLPLDGYPKIQYAIVIDAGSTGSRVHIYRFNYCKESPVLEDEVFVVTKPGLSSYTDPIQAAQSLDVLLKVISTNSRLR